MELEDLRAEHFEEHVGREFRLATEDGDELELTLVEAKVVGGGSADRRRPFSLLWRGPREPLLAQGIYTLAAPAESEALGRLDLFLVPLGPDGGSAGEAQGLLYEAVFT